MTYRAQRTRFSYAVHVLVLLTVATILALPTESRATPSCSASASVTCFAATGSIGTYTVTSNGAYSFLVYGGQGGASTTGSGHTGGLGAELGATFNLKVGDVLKIAVGSAGQTAFSNGGGGGGSFVVLIGGPDDPSNTVIPLLIAAGGGGAGNTGPTAGIVGSATTAASAGSGTNGGAAGTGGNGASAATGGATAGGGAGFFSNGAANNTNAAQGGADFANGLAGGTTTNTNGGTGGFGGGGGGGLGNTGGGGGGYNGGGGGFNGGNGGGGGSYLDSTLGALGPLTAISGINSGDGMIIMTQQSSSNAPEPASLGLLAIGLAGLIAARRRARTLASGGGRSGRGRKARARSGLLRV